jgi:uncharacterized membrane protein
MNIYFLIGIFIIINIIQTWFILFYNSLSKGGLIVAVIEIMEFPLMIYMLYQNNVTAFLVIVITEAIQLLSIAYFSTKN